MANIHDCLNRAVSAGELDQGRAAAAGSEYDQLVERYKNIMPLSQAEVTAGLHLKEATQKARRSRRHMILNQLQMMKRIRTMLEESPDAAAALLDMFETGPGSSWKGETVVGMTQAMQARIRSDIQGFLKQAGLNVTGRSRDVALVRDVTRELHLQDTGNAAAKDMAEAVRASQNWLRKMFNAHGGDIGELADHGVRHLHGKASIEDAGFERWAADIYDLLDWSRIIDLDTGQPFSAKGAKPARDVGEPFLEKIYSNIVTGGWNTRQPSLTFGGKALYNKRAEARILHFQDGDAWLTYNDSYGVADPFTSIVGGLDAVARDVAMMRVFGPNPNAGLNYAAQVVTKLAETSGNGAIARRAKTAIKRAATMMKHVGGEVNQPEREGWARAFSNLRHINVATKLGSAVLSAVSDLGTITAGSVAMKMNPANMLTSAVTGVSGASKAQAARMGFVSETLMSLATSSSRLTNDVVANDWAGRMSGFVIRASGLSWWTDQMRIAVQMEGAGHLADNAGKALDEIDPMWRNLLERHGINAKDWDDLRAPKARFIEGNADFIAPFWWLEHQTTRSRQDAEGLALRLQSALQDLQELFVPSKRVRGTSLLIGDSRPGTIGGEILRSTGGFKNYAISLTIGQIRLFQSIPTPQGKYAYLATMGASTLALGMLALQLKELSKGRDPRPMDEPKVWLAAGLQGGGMGIFGDFLFSEKNRFGGGLEQTIAGPVAGTIGDTLRVPVSNAVAALRGEETHLGRDVANWARYNTPVLSSYWPTRVAFDRLVADQLQQMLDGEAERAWRRQEKRRAREFGNETWWQRGAVSPERGPDLSSALGGG